MLPRTKDNPDQALRSVRTGLSVEENLLIGRRVMRRDGHWTLDRVFALFPALAELRRKSGAGLSGGEQKMLAIGRALMGNPLLLILDEPSEGLSPLMVQTLIGAIQQIRSDRVTLLVADQNAKFARRIADRAYIMEKGRITYSGTIEGLWASAEVVRKYLAL